jgi:hypothetical protein
MKQNAMLVGAIALPLLIVAITTTLSFGRRGLPGVRRRLLLRIVSWAALGCVAGDVALVLVGCPLGAALEKLHWGMINTAICGWSAMIFPGLWAYWFLATCTAMFAIWAWLAPYLPAWESSGLRLAVVSALMALPLATMLIIAVTANPGGVPPGDLAQALALCVPAVFGAVYIPRLTIPFLKPGTFAV